MPTFFFDLTGPEYQRRDDLGMACDSLASAYLEVVGTIRTDGPAMVRQGGDAAALVYRIRDGAERVLAEVPFARLLDETAVAHCYSLAELKAQSRALREQARSAQERARCARARADAAIELSRLDRAAIAAGILPGGSALSRTK